MSSADSLAVAIPCLPLEGLTLVRAQGTFSWVLWTAPDRSPICQVALMMGGTTTTVATGKMPESCVQVVHVLLCAVTCVCLGAGAGRVNTVAHTCGHACMCMGTRELGCSHSAASHASFGVRAQVTGFLLTHRCSGSEVLRDLPAVLKLGGAGLRFQSQLLTWPSQEDYTLSSQVVDGD